jgi:hypothetical protein
VTTQPHPVGDVDPPPDAHHQAPPNTPYQTAASDRGGSGTANHLNGAALRDILVDLINTNTSSRPALRAQSVATPLSRDRHAIDVTDDYGKVWRVDVHDHPRSQREAA